MRRLLLIALPAAALAAPLPAAAAETSLDDTAAALNDPAMQDRMADSVAALVGALMQMRVGPLAEAVARVDPDSDAAYIPPDATLGEIAGRDPYYGERLGDDVRAGAHMAGDMAAALSAYAPVLKDMARDMAAQWDRERAAARRR